MELVDKYSYKGIDSHLIWIYKSNGRTAGINRNNNVLGGKYSCFEENYGAKEGCQTVWYPNLEAARKVIRKYLNGEITNIPVRIC